METLYFSLISCSVSSMITPDISAPDPTRISASLFHFFSPGRNSIEPIPASINTPLIIPIALSILIYTAALFCSLTFNIFVQCKHCIADQNHTADMLCPVRETDNHLICIRNRVLCLVIIQHRCKSRHQKTVC